ncbi:MAG: hypothetical protein M3Q18_00650 [Actinomycetota bacterium]|nr:hypothetical protein [Actinomycetota bacterium]
MRRVEQFELIRKDDEAGLSIREIVRKRGVHRRTVRQALRSAFNRGVATTNQASGRQPRDARRPLGSSRTIRTTRPAQETHGQMLTQAMKAPVGR